MNLQKKVEIYLEKKRCTRAIDVVQYDTGIQLVFALMDFIAPDSTTATLYVQKPSGKFVYQEDDITVSGDTITIDLHNQALTEFGNVLYQVQMKNGDNVISTFAGTMQAQKSLANVAAVESKTVISSFNTVTAEKIAEIQVATKTQIALVQAESLRQQETIAGKGATTLATIPDDYTSTYNMAAEALRTKAPVIVQSASGSSIHVADSAEMPLQGLKIEGKEEQKQYSGKNKYPLQDNRAVSIGITAVFKDNNVSLSGTSTSSGGRLALRCADFVLSAGDYILSRTDIQSTSLILHNSSNNSIIATMSATEVAFTLSAETTVFLGVNVNTESTYSGNFDIMIRLASVTDATYEPYTGGASPNPNYPQAIYNSGECVELQNGAYNFNTGIYITEPRYVSNRYKIPCNGGDVVRIKTEQIFNQGGLVYYNEDTYVSKSNVIENVDFTEFEATVPSGVTHFNFDLRQASAIDLETVGKIELTVNGKYVLQVKSETLNMCSLVDKASTTVNGYTYSCSNQLITASGTSTGNGDIVVNFAKNITFEAGKNYTISLQGEFTHSANLSAYFYNALTNSYSIPIGIGNTDVRTFALDGTITAKGILLRGFSGNSISGSFNIQIQEGNTATDYVPHKESISAILLDEPTRAVNDVKDIIEYVNDGYKVRRKILNNVYNGSESGWVFSKANGGYGYFHIGTEGRTYSTSELPNVLCDSFTVLSGISQYNKPTQDCILSNRELSSDSRLWFITSKATDLASWKTWLTSNPITVQYEMAEEVIEDIADQTPFYQIQTFDGGTIIGTIDRQQPALEVEYATDTKRYIDNKFAELQTALANAVL